MRAERTQGGLSGNPSGERVPGMWLASLELPSSVHGGAEKSATPVGLRAPAGRFDAAQGGSIDTGSGRRAVSSSPGRGPWAAGSLSGMPGDAEGCIEMMCLPLVLSLAPFGGAGCCPRPPLPWHWGGCGHDRGIVGGWWLRLDAKRR